MAALPLDGLSSRGLFAKPSSPICLWLERISWGLVGRPRPTRGSMALQRALSKRGHRGGDSLPNCPFPARREERNSKRPKGLVGPFSKPLCSNAYEGLLFERAKLSPSMAGGSLQSHRAPCSLFQQERGGE